MRCLFSPPSLSFAHWLVGWLGIGLVGLIGLVISSRIDLYGGHAVAESGHGSGDVPIYAAQLGARKSLASPEQKAAALSEQAERSRILYVVDTAMIAMVMVDIGMFALHEL